MIDFEMRLWDALDAALERYELVMGEKFPAKATFTFDPSHDFIAQTRPIADGVEIIVSAGVVTRLMQLWSDTMQLSDDLPADNQLNVRNVDEAIGASLMWLMLHELHHYQIGHFELTGAAGLSETGLIPEYGLVQRSMRKLSKLERLENSKRLAIRRCLELQADHDALEILFDHYSDQGWGYIRYYMACAMAVMVLIEQQGNAPDDERSYPLSATRIFQLFSALAYLWMPGPNSNWEAPDEAEIDAYYQTVVIPAVSDAIIIATAGKTEPIIQSFEEVDKLFYDMRILAEPDKHDLSQLETMGAKEYASLMGANAEAIELLGPERFSR